MATRDGTVIIYRRILRKLSKKMDKQDIHFGQAVLKIENSVFVGKNVRKLIGFCSLGYHRVK